ncbi:UPF0340 protein [Clostridia bacterium]|nr:UPF0340 protein [Clostridia bacterium]
MNIDDVRLEFESLLDEFVTAVKPSAGQLIVLGCSTSEISGGIIGKSGSLEVGAMIMQTLSDKIKPTGADIAVQCCEHLNRALVIERAVAVARNYEIVSAVPHERAGGSAATAAYRSMNDPVLVEEIRADAGIDIGDTFIGMHLKRVVVPVRLSSATIGNAHVTFARTRAKYIGGDRARYE